MSKNQERIEKLMQTGNTNFIYRKELDKACFQYDMAYNPPAWIFLDVMAHIISEPWQLGVYNTAVQIIQIWKWKQNV